MAVMGDSKGGGNLAQSFMNNTATQASQELPRISAPQRFSTPQPAQAPAQAPQAPPMGSMAPDYTAPNLYERRQPGAFDLHGHSNLRDRGSQIFGPNGAVPNQPPQQAAPAAQPAPQPTRYQLIAQAINDRAAARLNNRGS